MDYLRRHVEPRLTRLAGKFPVTVLTGARQTGKTTLLRHLFEGKAAFFTFDPVTDVGNARQDPELFLRLHAPPLVLDEVQHAPGLLAVIKRIVDERPRAKGQYVVTGSQQIAVLGSVRESLAGRAFLLDLWPMSQLEMEGGGRVGLLGALFADPPAADARLLLERLRPAPGRRAAVRGLLERMFVGGYPALLDLDTADAPGWFESYLRTYVERDAREVRDVSSPHEFARFLRLTAALTAREMNASQLGREIGVAPRTARAWMETLRVSFQAVVIDAFSGNTVKRVSGRPKAHLADTGLACHLLGISSPTGLGAHPALGHIFETHVVMEIVRQASAMDTRPALWHWRAAGGAEADLVLERDGVYVPLEVKLSSRPSRRDAWGLASFAETYPGLRIGPRVVIHGGADLFLLDEQTVAVPADLL